MSSIDGKDDHRNGQPGPSSVNGAGFRPTGGHIPGSNNNPMVNVQPPRREDLQPSYAQTLVGESDQGNHGWYGSMINGLGSCIGTMGAIPCCIICPNPYKPVSQGNVGLVTKFGRFYRAVRRVGMEPHFDEDNTKR